MKLVKVTWRDAIANSEWLSDDDAKDLEPAHCVTVGHLVVQTAEKINVAATDGDGDCPRGNVWSIPAGWVERIEYL